MSTDCIFCKIVSGTIPSTKVYEDADCLAFLDISPIVKGHTLVIPKPHHETISDVPVALLGKVIAAVQKVVLAQKKGIKADGVNVAQANGSIAGQVVPHLHFHIIPRFKNDPHTWGNPQGKYDSPAERDRIAASIREAIG